MTGVPPARLVMLGIDAANPELLEQWAADGTLPNLAKLISRGAVTRTRGVEGFFVGSTWPSMYTATTPAGHGVHYLLQLIPGTYRLHWVAEAEFVRRAPFWEALSHAGRRVAVLDVPLTRLSKELNGIQVVEWGGHDSVYGFRTTPDDLASTLRTRHGTHPLGGSCDRSRRTVEDYASFVDALEAGVRRKASWTGELLDRGGWDLFMQVFTESHCVGHQCWHLHDPGHPAYDPAFAARHGDPLQRVYRAIDTAIGDLLARAGDARVMVFSAHGMAHRYGAQFLLRDILVRLGVTVPEAPSGDEQTTGGVVRRLARGVWNKLPVAARRPIRAIRSRGTRQPSGAPRVPTLRVDAGRSACFPLNNGLAVGGIRLNLAGREPNGALQPGAEADEFCDRLAADLTQMVDDRTGRPLVRRVIRTDTIYAGDQRDALPDLLVEWDDTTPLDSSALGDSSRGRVRARSDATGVIEGVNDYARTGEHRLGGWLVVSGPGIGAGRLERSISLLDIAPTACAMLGTELPDVDGSVIREILGA